MPLPNGARVIGSVTAGIDSAISLVLFSMPGDPEAVTPSLVKLYTNAGWEEAPGTSLGGSPADRAAAFYRNNERDELNILVQPSEAGTSMVRLALAVGGGFDETTAVAVTPTLATPPQGVGGPLPPHVISLRPANGESVRLDFNVCIVFDVSEAGLGPDPQGPIRLSIGGREFVGGVGGVDNRDSPTRGTVCSATLQQLLESDMLVTAPCAGGPY